MDTWGRLKVDAGEGRWRWLGWILRRVEGFWVGEAGGRFGWVLEEVKTKGKLWEVGVDITGIWGGYCLKTEGEG